jgi:hypothetical protein
MQKENVLELMEVARSIDNSHDSFTRRKNKKAKVRQ